MEFILDLGIVRKTVDWVCVSPNKENSLRKNSMENCGKQLLLGAIVTSTFFLASMVQSAASETGDAKDRLERTLKEMGYSEIVVETCRISFAREIIASEANYGYSKYVRTINLRNLQLDDLTYVKRKRAGRISFYEISAPFNTQYKNAYRAVTLFGMWVRASFPGLDWPYKRLADHNAFSPVIETKLRDLLPDISKMNTWTRFAKFGPVTSFPFRFRLSFGEPLLLSEFRRAMIEHSKKSGC
jgi:hypothetical protein